MTLNDPMLVHALTALHDEYERALAANDVAALTAFFWDSPKVVRYGPAEQLYGADSVQAYRQSHTPAYSSRRILKREIATFGSDFATIMSEIELIIDGGTRRNRQSQTWVKLPELGWRIVAAHVSVPAVKDVSEPAATGWQAYIDLMALTLQLPSAVTYRAGVAANLERTAAIAAPLLAFSISDEAEPAPVFSA
jgi:ketosteroid isomerase-like protein